MPGNVLLGVIRKVRSLRKGDGGAGGWGGGRSLKNE